LAAFHWPLASRPGYAASVGRVASQDALRPGTVLSGKIRIERVVGQGSMGIVLEATDLPLQRRVAVKLMAPERASNEESRKRFLREARAAVRLSSEHVTRLIDVGELDDGTPYLVMEFLVGATLEVVLVRDGPPPIDVAVDWVLQALDGVAEAHRAGFVHRDLKPENLFLCERPDRSPIVKVLDFGTVKDLVTKGTKLTRTGATMGSPAYMPPEQVRAEEIDQRADVWAMGVTLYELTTGRLPFGGESVPQTLAAILRDHHVPLRVRRPDAPPELEALIACALSKDPAGRYASATELLGALSLIRAKLPSTTRVTKTVRLGQNFRLSRPDELADTTDMARIVEGTDASRVRPRVVVNDMPQSSSHGSVARGPLERTHRRSKPSYLPTLFIAAGVAIVIGAIVGAVVSRRRPPQPKTTTTSSAAASTASTAAATPPSNSAPQQQPAMTTTSGVLRPADQRKPHVKPK
jgi:serine/threonine protein kinase